MLCFYKVKTVYLHYVKFSIERNLFPVALYIFSDYTWLFQLPQVQMGKSLNKKNYNTLFYFLLEATPDGAHDLLWPLH